MNKQNFFILIPAYNAEPFLPKLVEELSHIISKKFILVVNDGSTDDTLNLAIEIGVNTISHEQNRGKAAALKSGFQWGIQEGYQWAITMDADGQHSPQDLPNFFEYLNKVDDELKHLGALLGARDFGGTMPWARRFSNRTTTGFLERLSDQKLWDSQCGYRAYGLDALKTSQCLDIPTSGFQWESEVLVKLSWAGYQFEKVHVQTIYNNQGSHISHVNDTLKFIKMWLRLKKQKKLRKY